MRMNLSMNHLMNGELIWMKWMKINEWTNKLIKCMNVRWEPKVVSSIHTCVCGLWWRKSYSSWIWLTAASTNPINM